MLFFIFIGYCKHIKTFAGNRSQYFNEELKKILEEPATKTPSGMEGFCNQIAEILNLIRNPVKRVVQASLLTFLSNKLQEPGIVD